MTRSESRSMGSHVDLNHPRTVLYFSRLKLMPLHSAYRSLNPLGVGFTLMTYWNTRLV